MHKDYRNQDISLFSYYIYALILSYVERINNDSLKNKVYLEANNNSSVSKITQHTKCPYCPYYNEVLYLISNPDENTKEKHLPPEMFLNDWFNKIGSLYLNPEKRTQRQNSNFEEIIENKTLSLDDMKFQAIPTHKHIHFENEKKF